MACNRGKVFIVSSDYVVKLETALKLTDKELLNVKNIKIGEKRNFILEFCDGKNTLPFFKILYANNLFDVVYITVCNFELFYDIFSLFKDNCSFIYQENIKGILPVTNKRFKKYLKIDERLRNSVKPFKNITQSEAQELSFFPDILSSIASSLIDPTIYLSNPELTCSKIYIALKDGPKTHEYFKSLSLKLLDVNLKSLLACKIIEKKKDKFYLRNQIDLTDSV